VKVAPVLNKLEGVVVVVMVEEKASALAEQVNLGVKTNIPVNTPELWGKVARKHDIVNGNDKALPLTTVSIVGRSMQKMVGRKIGVERSKEFEVDQFAGIHVMESLRKTENSAYAPSAVAYRPRAC
jgi:hypothetical protein